MSKEFINRIIRKNVQVNKNPALKHGLELAKKEILDIENERDYVHE